MSYNEPQWLLKQVVQSFHDQQLAEHGGAQGIRDETMLDSALNKPIQMWNYGQPSIPELAAAYAFSIAKNHPYVDGNKRTAAIACEVFLLLNGYEFTVDETVKYPHYLALASGEHSQDSFTEWLIENTAPAC